VVLVARSPAVLVLVPIGSVTSPVPPSRLMV
jgi:hypothetical protein